ncbi:hypothetical protein Mal15_16490 [Stieleria maiorica]|uniref:Uncharacterized protein n=1 Tax=Stieleria maiorica TaxID=2795974 RepID=A0A5B9M8X5_9BACT|nr:hypothetical protein [Stieleria maiorica]QEF97608.1 hypothetical protein Mal15_16490 [Stieleria maiorica]
MECRAPETCRHREVVDSSDTGEIAVCRLLKSISGINNHTGLQVSAAACRACCGSYPPSQRDLNPIVASLLFALTEQVIDENGVAGCNLESAKKLNRWAERSLPAVAPDEDDCVDWGRKSYDHLRAVTVDSIADLLPRPETPPPGSNQNVATWAVGVTTAARRLPTLERSVGSILTSGWSDPRLFIDGKVDVPQSLERLVACRRSPAVGAFPNYMLSLGELFMRDPHADAYMMIQDDALFLGAPAMRDYLESVLWPDDGPWIASLYCSKAYTQASAGWHRFPDRWVWGAVAFVFSPEALRRILTSPLVSQHRRLPDGKGLSRIDVVIGQIANSDKIPILFPCPSLVQHIGTVSTIWKLARAVNSRHANQFIGDLLDR